MELKYGLNSKPEIFDTLIYGLQWFAVTIPAVVIIEHWILKKTADPLELEK